MAQITGKIGEIQRQTSVRIDRADNCCQVAASIIAEMTHYLLTRMQSAIVCFEMTQDGIKPHSKVKTFANWQDAAKWLSSLGISEQQLTAASQAVSAGNNATLSVLH